ncbi:hypothetical protein ES708_25528 [subsurface metagenome]
MNDNEIRNAILEFAYNKPKVDGGIEGEEGGRFTTDELSKLERFEGIEKNIIDFNIDYLVKEDSLKWPVMGLLVITRKGVNCLRIFNDVVNNNLII